MLQQQHQLKAGRWQLGGADVGVAHAEALGQAGVGQPPAGQVDDAGVQVDAQAGELWAAGGGRVDQVDAGAAAHIKDPPRAPLGHQRRQQWR